MTSLSCEGVADPDHGITFGYAMNNIIGAPTMCAPGLPRRLGHHVP
ncbi:hypothetical protein [Streptomyces sp. KR55]